MRAVIIIRRCLRCLVRYFGRRLKLVISRLRAWLVTGRRAVLVPLVR